ncbi:MAG: hypothetical protein WD768_06370 [Phycisphaeraceae bacterium]
MELLFTPVLAITTDQIIMIGIAIVAILGGIFGENNKNKKRKKPGSSSADGSSGSSSGTAVDLEEIARRRRQQLEALARQRRGGSGSASTSAAASSRPAPPAEVPSAVSAHDRIEEMRRQQLAEEMKHESSRTRSEPTQSRADMTGKEQREGASTQRRNVQQRRERDQKSQRAQQASQRANEAARQQADQRSSRSRIEREDLPSASKGGSGGQGGPRRQPEDLGSEIASRHVGHDDLGSGASQVDPMHTDYYVDGDVSHRHVSDVIGDTPAARAGLLAKTGLKSWKHAIMIKEILDQPISIREGGTTIDPLRL